MITGNILYGLTCILKLRLSALQGCLTHPDISVWVKILAENHKQVQLSDESPCPTLFLQDTEFGSQTII